MDKIMQAFNPETGKEKDDKGERIHKGSKHIYSGRVEFPGIISIVMSHVGIL
jgi:ferredoxin-fold anticodon binding domain-containing protein